MQRRTLLLAPASAMSSLDAVALPKPDAYAGAGVAALSAAMASGRLSAAQLVERYLVRIEAIDRHGPKLNSIIELNPDARGIARALDAERKAGHVRGPLHGIPVLLKDNIATGDAMRTSAGSLALADLRVARDAHLVRRLRESGAVILGKTNLSEWANIRSTRSTSGWSARGGLTRNPYALDRNCSGSSAGTGAAIAADLASIGVGTETDGSIVSPASICGLVGLKPSVGRISRDGIIPISHTQDTAGPMARTVADAAALYAAMCGPDGADRISQSAPEPGTWVPAAGAMRGARLGVARAYFIGYDEADAIIEQAITTLRALGAEIIDDVDLPPVAYADAELSVLLYELKAGLSRWLAEFAPRSGLRSLTELIDFNRQHRDEEMPWFGQELFERADKLGDLDSPAYVEALAACAKGSREDSLDRVFDKHRLDAIIAPTGGPAWLTDPVNGDHVIGGFSTPAAVAGYPHLTVPAGLVHGLPIGLSFVGRLWSEWRLLELGQAFEAAAQARRPPRYFKRSVPV